MTLQAVRRHSALAALLCSLGITALTGSVPACAEEIRHPLQSYRESLGIDDTITGTIPQKNAPRLETLMPEPPATGLPPTFRQIATDARLMRFDGEIGAVDLPVYIRSDQLIEPPKLRLRYLSAVTVMPEASRLLAYVNDQQVAEIALDAASLPGTAEIALPAGLLQPGYNSIRLAAQHRHRVDCTVNAANELWTQIDPVASGIVLGSANDQVTSLDGLIGLPLTAGGAYPITVILPPETDTAAIDLAVQAAQALAVRANATTPKVMFTRTRVKTPGIQLFVGTRQTLASMGIHNTKMDQDAVSVEGQSSGTVRVIVTGATPKDIAAAINQIAAEGRMKEARGTAAGLRALRIQKGLAIDAGQEISLAAFGQPTQEFSGRLFKTSFNLLLPNDFYPADNGKAVLQLDAGLAKGVMPNNEALIKVNGKIVAATRMVNTGSENAIRRTLEIALRAFNPGPNRVAIEIHSATEEDRNCNPLTMLDSRKRLTLANTTSLTLPRFARAASYPSLGAITGAGLNARSLSAHARPVTLVLPRADTSSLGATATFLARSASVNGVVTPVRLTTQSPETVTGPAIIVGAIADIPETILEHFKLTGDTLPRPWRPSVGQALPEAVDPTRQIQIMPEKPAAAATLQVTTLSPRASFTATTRKTEEEEVAATSSSSDNVASLDTSDENKQPTGLYERGVALLTHLLQRHIGFSADQLWLINRHAATVALQNDTSLILAQAPSLTSRRDSWLLLTGVSAAALQNGATELGSPPNWQQVHGRLATLDTKGQNVTTIAATDHYGFDIKDRSISNLTLFAAGWLSNNILYYVAALLAACLLLGIFSRKLLNHVGQKP